MTFDDSYLKDAGEIITKKKIRAIEDTGYINFENKDKNIIYTFLSNQILRTWYHHFTGTYGVIIINEGINFNDNINEISNLLNSKILIKRPFLIVYDKKKIYNEKCNVWYCGIIISILLTAELPFNGRDDEEIHVLCFCCLCSCFCSCDRYDWMQNGLC